VRKPSDPSNAQPMTYKKLAIHNQKKSADFLQ
jgi:hypothetical protein